MERRHPANAALRAQIDRAQQAHAQIREVQAALEHQTLAWARGQSQEAPAPQQAIAALLKTEQEALRSRQHALAQAGLLAPQPVAAQRLTPQEQAALRALSQEP